MGRVIKGEIDTIKITAFIEKRPVIILMFISLISALIVFSRFVFGDKLFVYTDLNMDTYLSYIHGM